MIIMFIVFNRVQSIRRRKRYDIRLPIEVWLNIVEIIQKDEKCNSRTLCKALGVRHDWNKERIKIIEYEIDLLWNLMIKREVIIENSEIIQRSELEEFEGNRPGWVEEMFKIGRIPKRYRMTRYKTTEVMDDLVIIRYSKVEKEIWEKMFDY